MRHRMIMKVYSAFLIIFGIVSPSFAGNIPGQLLGKTIGFSFAVGGPAKTQDGRVVSTNRRVTEVIYVSSAGRVFARINQNSKAGSALREQVTGTGEGSWRFVNGQLISARRRISGARMTAISFDSNFQSCAVSSVGGSESGKPYSWKGLDGQIYEAIGPLSFSATGCSVSVGNGL